LRVNLFSLGAAATRLRRQAMPGEEPAMLARPEDIAPQLAALCLDSETRHGAIVCPG
jgi:hypothetical protein